jgi:sulfite reductase alpha subunit-like flavoprotein
MFGQGDSFVEFYNFMARFMDRIIELRGGELMAKRM